MIILFENTDVSMYNMPVVSCKGYYMYSSERELRIPRSGMEGGSWNCKACQVVRQWNPCQYFHNDPLGGGEAFGWETR